MYYVLDNLLPSVSITIYLFCYFFPFFSLLSFWNSSSSDVGPSPERLSVLGLFYYILLSLFYIFVLLSGKFSQYCLLSKFYSQQFSVSKTCFCLVSFFMAPNLLRFLCGDYLAGFFLLLYFLQRLFHFFCHCGSGSASGGGAGHQGASLQGGWAQSWLQCWRSSKCRVQVFT